MLPLSATLKLLLWTHINTNSLRRLCCYVFIFHIKRLLFRPAAGYGLVLNHWVAFWQQTHSGFWITRWTSGRKRFPYTLKPFISFLPRPKLASSLFTRASLPKCAVQCDAGGGRWVSMVHHVLTLTARWEKLLSAFPSIPWGWEN